MNTLTVHFIQLPLDPRICTLTPNGHVELGALSGPRGSYSSEKSRFTNESRKSSVMSLGKSSLERRSLSLVLSHPVIHRHTCTHVICHSEHVIEFIAIEFQCETGFWFNFVTA